MGQITVKKKFSRISDGKRCIMSQLQNRGGRRDSSVDILKGLAIILVVYGHTWPFCRNFIYLFHMAVFMMASGYCYLNQVVSVKEYGCYILKKIRALYLPFVICNGVFLLCSGLFLKIGFFTNDPQFLVLTESWPIEQSLYVYRGTMWLGKQMLKVLAFIGPSQMGTATWFLTTLFIVLILHSGLFLILKRYNKTVITFYILIIMLILSQIVSNMNIVLLYAIKCLPCTYAAFLFGILIKNVKWNSLYSWWMGGVSFIILVIISQYYSIEISAAKIENVPIYIVASCAGWVLLKSFSELILKCKALARLMRYIGKHTLPIMCIHVLSFKLVSLIYIIIENKPIALLAGFHVIFDANELWKLLYLVVGIIIPIGLYEIYKKFNVKNTRDVLVDLSMRKY